MRPLLAQHTPNVVNISTLPHEGSSDKVNILGDTEIGEIRDVLLGEGGEVDDGPGQVHVLALANGGGVLHLGGGGREGERKGREMRRQILSSCGV